MNVDALYLKYVIMSQDTSETDKITALIAVLESMDKGYAFPQLIVDTLIGFGITKNQGSPSIKMLSYEILGSIASDGDQKASEGIMESVKYDLANPSGEVVFSALDSLNALTGSYLVRFVHTIDLERIVRKSITNSFPMVRKQAVYTFSLLALRCQCALSGLAFKDEAYDSSRGRAEQIQETVTKCREIIRCVAEALNDDDVRVVAECCKALYMVIEENNKHIYSKADEGFNYHTSEEARETLTISPSLVWDLIPDVGELLLAQTYTMAGRIQQCKGLEASYIMESISEALLMALRFNEAAGYDWTPRIIRLEHMATPQSIPCDEVASYWVNQVLSDHLCNGDPEAMFMAAKYTLLLCQYKLLSINKQRWTCTAFIVLIRIMQSSYGIIDPIAIAELMVEGIRSLPKSLYFPANDSAIVSLYGQGGIPTTRDLIIISRSGEKIQQELFNIPCVSVCYRAIYTVRNVKSRISLLLTMARILVKSMLREGNTDYVEKVMTSSFITHIFKQEDGDVFKEEIVSSLLTAIGDEKPRKSTLTTEYNRWCSVALNVLYSTADCLCWKSESGIAAEKYLSALFSIATTINEEKKEEKKVEMTPQEEEDDDESLENHKNVLQRVLKHLVVAILPKIIDSSQRLQTIWILAQFVVSIELQRVLLGLILNRLRTQDVAVVTLDERYARFQHSSLATAGSVMDLSSEKNQDDMVLADLLLRCVLHIVTDNEDLAVIGYRAIQEYIQRSDLSLPARENALNILARISLSVPSSYQSHGYLIPEEDKRIETEYSFLGSFSPSQDTDCGKQQKIRNIHEPAEVYRQSIQNALIIQDDNEEEKVQKTAQRSLVYKSPLIHIRSTLSGGSDPLLIVGTFRPQAENHQLILRMSIYNATHVDLSGITVNVAAQGSLSMSTLRREARFDMKGVLRPRASVTWEAPLEVSTFERGTAQPLITIKKGEEDVVDMKGNMKEGVGDLVLPYTPIQIKFTDLLLPAQSHLLYTQPFRVLWSRLGYSVHVDALIDQTPGQFLSEHLACERIRGPQHAIGYVQIPEIPTSNHLQAAGLSCTWNGDWLAYYCIGTYTCKVAERSMGNTATATATATATVTVTPTPNEEEEVEERKRQAVWKIHYEFRSSSEQVMNAIHQNCQHWLDDLTDEQVTLVNIFKDSMDENYRVKESVVFPGDSNLQLENDMSTEDVLYKWNCLKRNRKNRYVEIAAKEEPEETIEEE